MTLKSLLLCLMVWGAMLTPATAAEHHHHGGEAGLHLNQGQKWATDGPLRQGMANIRAAMADKLPTIHAKRLNQAEYGKLAQVLEQEVGAIVATCKLPEEADAVLHPILAELGAGIDAMAGRTKRALPRQGALKVLGALEKYDRYFDHPGWQPLGH